jgi:hypothetical protein
VKQNSVAALLIAINFYQTVSALSQYPFYKEKDRGREGEGEGEGSRRGMCCMHNII